MAEEKGIKAQVRDAAETVIVGDKPKITEIAADTAETKETKKGGKG